MTINRESQFARWVTCALPEGRPLVCDYRLTWRQDQSAAQTITCTADQRFILRHNGKVVARGPHRGDVYAWHTQSLDLQLAAGQQELIATVWSLPKSLMPLAQLEVGHGWLLEGGPLSTGVADWQVRSDTRRSFTRATPLQGIYAGPLETFDATQPLTPWQPAAAGLPGNDRWDIDQDRGFSWGEHRAPRLTPTPLPPMLEQDWPTHRVRRGPNPEAWQALAEDRQPLTIASNNEVTVMFDLDGYVCGYDDLKLDGGAGATVTLTWAEALKDREGKKHQRNQIEGLECVGRHHTLHLAGGPLSYQPLWWTSGRYRQVTIRTADEPLTLHRLGVIETRYPLESRGSCDLAENLQPICWRALQCCAHETYVDCPYYEQLQYISDTRIQALTSYVWAGDDRLGRQAIRLFSRSLNGNGLLQARYPSQVAQTIPGFALYWVGMLHDLWLWRSPDEQGDPLVRAMMPTARSVIENFLNRINDDGLCDWPDGWDYVDCQPGWRQGKSPDLSINALHLLYSLTLMIDLERWVGEPMLADRLDARRQALATAIDRAYWRDDLGAWQGGDVLTQHAQCFGILAGVAPKTQRQRAGEALFVDHATRASLSIQHYVFEALHALGRGAEMLDHLGPWQQMLKLGLKTTPEHAEPTRSDCHAWSCHPLFHLLATVAGIRPTAPGMRQITLRPAVPNLIATCMTPLGPVELSQVEGQLDYRLPDGVHVETRT
jgi:hypothetical protein